MDLDVDDVVVRVDHAMMGCTVVLKCVCVGTVWHKGWHLCILLMGQAYSRTDGP